MMNNSRNDIDASETLDLILDILNDLTKYKNTKAKDLSIQKKLTALDGQIDEKNKKSYEWITTRSVHNVQWTKEDPMSKTSGIGFEASYAGLILKRVYLCEFIRKRAEVGIKKSNFLKILLKFMKDKEKKPENMGEVLSMISSQDFPVKDGLFNRPTGWNKSCKTLALSASTAYDVLIHDHLKNLNVLLTNYKQNDKHNINLDEENKNSFTALQEVIESNGIKKN